MTKRVEDAQALAARTREREDTEARIDLASHQWAPEEVLTALSGDLEESVRRAVAVAAPAHHRESALLTRVAL